MPKGSGGGVGDYFPRVKAAREALRSKAMEFLMKYERIIDLAIEKGDLEVAGKHVQWLIEHTAAEDGERIIDPSAAKPKEIQGTVGPTIQIGIALNPKPKILGPKVIDIETIDDDNDTNN